VLAADGGLIQPSGRGWRSFCMECGTSRMSKNVGRTPGAGPALDAGDKRRLPVLLTTRGCFGPVLNCPKSLPLTRSGGADNIIILQPLLSGCGSSYTTFARWETVAFCNTHAGGNLPLVVIPAKAGIHFDFSSFNLVHLRNRSLPRPPSRGIRFSVFLCVLCVSVVNYLFASPSPQRRTHLRQKPCHLRIRVPLPQRLQR